MKSDKSFHICGLLRFPAFAKGISLLVCTLVVQNVFAQTDANPDFMRSTGKIYVVAAVTFVILLALFVYLIMIDRKITRIEKRQKNE
jgi:ABC-type Fe3+-siderophore transport system permease subunit